MSLSWWAKRHQPNGLCNSIAVFHKRERLLYMTPISALKIEGNRFEGREQGTVVIILNLWITEMLTSTKHSS